MKKISWTDHARNEEVLLRVNEQRNTYLLTYSMKQGPSSEAS